MIILIRHAEAQKNLEDRHGGLGSHLTERGREQVICLGRYLRPQIERSTSVILVGHQLPQVSETVESLADTLSTVSITWDERLRGLNLGILAGLSRTEALERAPEAAERLELWRSGHLQINALQIPGAEAIDSFQSRLRSVLDEWSHCSEEDTVLAVCTRSTLIMLCNLLIQQTRFNYQDYKAYVFDSASITDAVGSGSGLLLRQMNFTEYLPYDLR